jgi:hypothetical protein
MILSGHIVDEISHCTGRSVTRTLFDFLGHAPSQKRYALSQVIEYKYYFFLPCKV